MVNTRNITTRLFLLTIGCIIFALFTAIFKMMILWFILVLMLSIFLIYRNKNKINKRDIIISLFLSIITMISNMFMGFFVMPTYLASIAVMRGSDKEILLYRHGNKRKLHWTLCCIFVFGGILACINLLLASQNYHINLSIQPYYIFDALRAGIFEEIVFRMFFFSLCIELTRNVVYNKYQEVLCYLLLVLPHVIVHFNGTIDFISVIVLSTFFGLPFAIMQRKLNLLSAIGAHSMVDFIRYIILGV